MIQVDQNTVVFLCDRSGIAARPWVAAGFRAVLVDTHVEGVADQAGVTRVRVDVRSWVGIRGRPFLVVGWPPCTHLAGVGAGSWASKGEAALLEGLSIADACLRIAVRSKSTSWAIENPVGRLSHYWGEPDHVFSPHEYGGWLRPAGDAYTKRTCLWVGGAFRMPTKRPVEPVEGSLVGVVSNVDRRSETPRGFSVALFHALRPGYLFPAGDELRSADVLRPGLPLLPAEVLGCEWCGRSFERGRTDHRYCSMRCRVAAHRARKPLHSIDALHPREALR